MENEKEIIRENAKEVQLVAPAKVGDKPKKKFNLFLIVISVIVVIIVGLIGYFLFSETINKSLKPQKVYHVGVLSALDYFYPTVDYFKKEMTKLGYIEGKNIFYDVQKAPAPVGNQKILNKFVQNKVDLIFVFPTEAALEAKDATKGTSIPIVATESLMEGTGLIESITQPGGNLTGVRFPTIETALNRFNLLHEVLPNAKRVWIPYLKDYPTVAPSIKELAMSAKSFGITLIEVPFSTPPEIIAYLNAHKISGLGADAILLIPEPICITSAFTDPIYEFADTNKIPIISASVLNLDYGPLIGLIASNAEYARLAAPLVDKIFKGVPAGTIPIVTPENDLEINYKVAQKLGLTIPEGLLGIATKIVR
jgi:putative tryptophan/tyrosine transport system substrate-binding protein